MRFFSVRFEKLRNRPFLKSMAVVAGGMAASQALSMAFVPIISRLYGPEAYGTQGVFMSIATVLAAVAALMYPTAMVLPDNDTDALDLGVLSLYIAVLLSIVVTVVFAIYGDALFGWLNARPIQSFMYLIPVFMLFYTVSTVVTQWQIRKKQFSVTARINVVQTLLVNLTKVAAGSVHPSASSLAATNTAGNLISPLLAIGRMKKTWHEGRGSFGQFRAKFALARRHEDFALLRSPQVLMNALSHSLPAILLSTQFGPAAVGYYALASAVLAAPAGLLGNSIMQVFYPRVTEAIKNGEDAKKLILKATGWLFLSCIPICIVVIAAGPYIFKVVFGAQWEMAGTYARWLTVWICFQYINKPAICAVPGLKIQRGLLLYEFFSTGSKILALYIGYVLFRSDVAAIALFACSGVAAYVWLITWVVYRSGKISRSI